VLGLGNDILTDDGIGLQVVRQLKAQGLVAPCVQYEETSEMGLALLDFITGYEAVFLVDSIQTGRVRPGHIYDLDAEGFAQYTGRSPHFLGVGETLELGRRLGLAMPATIRVIAVETEDPFTLSTELSPSLRAALPLVVEHVRKAILDLIQAQAFVPVAGPLRPTRSPTP
jgi:hydrogenase maturation protease